MRSADQRPDTWRQLFAAASVLLLVNAPEIPYWLKSDAIGALGKILAQGEAQKRAWALKALSTIPGELVDHMRLRSIKSPIRDSEASFLMLERLFVFTPPWGMRSWGDNIYFFLDQSALLFLLNYEFSFEESEREYRNDTADGTMQQCLQSYIMETLGGPQKAFLELLEQLELSDLFKNEEMPIEDKMVLFSLEDSNVKIPEFARATCLLLLHLSGLTDRILSDILPSNGGKLFESILIKTIVATTAPEATKSALFSQLNNINNSAQTRIRAAWILNKLGVAISHLELHKKDIQGYPYAWNGPVPFPTDLRTCLLSFYRNKMLSGSNLALLLEAQTLPAHYYEDYEMIDPTRVEFHGVDILGPYTATQLHDEGYGSYNAYKVYISSPYRAHERVLSMAVLLTSTLGPYGCIRRNDVVLSNSGRYPIYGTLFVGKEPEYVDEILDDANDALPTWDEAVQALRAFASDYGWTILDDNLLDCGFDGIIFNSLGGTAVPRIREMLFDFQPSR